MYASYHNYEGAFFLTRSFIAMSSKGSNYYLGRSVVFLKVIIASALFSIFSFWSTKALIKYKERPISTQIDFRFGDDGKGNISMPNLSICVDKLDKFKNLTQCGYNSIHYTAFFFDCTSSNFTFEYFLNALHFPFTNLHVEIHPGILTGTEALKLQATLWKVVFHRVFGFCYNLNLNHIPRLKVIPISDAFGNPAIHIKMRNMDASAKIQVLMHSGYDAADAHDLYPHFQVELNTSSSAYLIKRVIHAINTDKHPCGRYAKQTCVYRSFYFDVKEKFNCESIFVPADYIGLEADSELTMCNNTVNEELLKYALDTYIERFNNCPIKQACHQPRYIMQLVQSRDESELNAADVKILLADPIVEYNIDSISYDVQSLIGEVGGTLGLTLGISFFSITKAFEYLVKKLQYHLNVQINFE